MTRSPRQSTRWLIHRFIVLIALAAMLVVAPPTAAKEGTRFRPAVTSTDGVVASISDYASRVGIDVLNRGGNAIDAAAAMVFAVGVARPDMGGIGGGGFLVSRSANNHTAALDFRETSPASEEFDSDVLSGPGMHRDTSLCAEVGSGHRVVGVPGVVAGMDQALRTLGSGKFTLGQLITNGGDISRPPYAYELAKNGFTISGDLGFWSFCEQQRLQYYEETRKIYAIGTGPSRPGDTLIQTDYAKSLLFIATHGADAFYADAAFPDPITRAPTDSIARRIAADMAAAEKASATNPVLQSRWPDTPSDPEDGPRDTGYLTVGDFQEYRPIWRTPLTSTYRGHRIIAMPPPTSGGIATIEILNLLEGFPLNENQFDTKEAKYADTSWAQSSANHLHVLAEAQKIAWADRNKYVADSDYNYDYDHDGDFEPVPTEMLTSKEYADGRRDEIDLTKAKLDCKDGEEPPSCYEPGVYTSSNTNHLSVIDRQGNAVAVTTTLEAAFGSVVVAPTTGFLLNSQLHDFNMTRPAGEDPPATANDPGPRKRPRSSASPTIVVKGTQPVLVVGGAGGSSIPLGVVQMIVNVVDFGLDIAHAIDAERVEARFWGDVLSIEAARETARQRVPDAVLNELDLAPPEGRGHTLRDAGQYSGFPIMAAVGVNLVTGCREAISDPRNETAGDFVDDFGQGAAAQLPMCN